MITSELPPILVKRYSGRWVALRADPEAQTPKVIAVAEEFRRLVADDAVKPGDQIDYVADPAPRQLGKRIREAREVRRLSVRAVADLAGISVTYLRKLEGGNVTTPSCRVLYRLHQVLEISYRQLMELAAYPVPREDGGTTSSP